MKASCRRSLAFLLLLGVSAFFPERVAHCGQSGFYSLSAVSLEGEPQSLKRYEGKVLLVVNTASQCGYTPQYEGLEELYKKFRDRGLVVLGFPSNDFGSQEPGSNKQIRIFCQSKYSVDFPMFAKGPVSGGAVQPVFQWLLKHSPTSEEIAWNFEKFLVSRDGQVLARFKSAVTPDSPPLVSAITEALSGK
jgi:glutathione peroxidase